MLRSFSYRVNLNKASMNSLGPLVYAWGRIMKNKESGQSWGNWYYMRGGFRAYDVGVDLTRRMEQQLELRLLGP